MSDDETVKGTYVPQQEYFSKLEKAARNSVNRGRFNMLTWLPKFKIAASNDGQKENQETTLVRTLKGILMEYFTICNFTDKYGRYSCRYCHDEEETELVAPPFMQIRQKRHLWFLADRTLKI